MNESESSSTDVAPATKPTVTCYSAGEGGFMDGSQALRGRWLRPLLDVLVRLRVTPNALTAASLLSGIAFCPVLLWGDSAVAFGLLVLHLLLDGIDGPLARYTGRASSRGSFTDTMADQIVVTLSAITMIHAGHAGVWPGSLYIFLYLLVVVFAMVRNALAIPYAWLVRPRIFVYAWFPVEVYLWPASLDWILWGMTSLLAIKVLTGFLKIRRRM